MLPTDDFATLPLEVVFADDAIVVLNKPSGLLTVPGRGPDKADCLSKRVQARYPDALIVHRLDRDTSGLVVLARGLPAQRVLNLAFEQRRVDKRYTAVVTGMLAVDGLWHEINLPMLVDWPNRPKRTINFEEGQSALTRWRCTAVDAAANTSRVELEPVTGRTHQLRVHMLAIGHPMVGDTLYAPPEVQAQADRLLLHSGLLSFPHPTTGTVHEYTVAPAF